MSHLWRYIDSSVEASIRAMYEETSEGAETTKKKTNSQHIDIKLLIQRLVEQ